MNRGSNIRVKQVVCFLFLSAFTASAPAAEILYGTTFREVGQLGFESVLVQIDTATGTTTAIGSVGYPVNGLAWDATTSTLYATTSLNEDNFYGLLTVDTTTGAGSEIGFGWPSETPTNLAANASGQLFSWNESGDDLIAVDKGLGTYSATGDAGISTASHSLFYDANGDLILLNFDLSVYKVDEVTGATTLIDTATGVANRDAHHGDFNMADGLLYALSRNGMQLNSFNSDYDLVNSVALDRRIHALAFVPGASTPVPEPASLLLWTLLGGAALVHRRSRRSRQS